MRDRVGQFVLVILFLSFAHSQWSDFQRTGHLTGLVYLVLLLLVVVMTISRRPPRDLSNAWPARLVAVVGTYGSLFFRPGGEALAPSALTVLISSIGLTIAILGVLALRRSFGVVAAHRGIVDTGVYGWIRHPLYLGYMLNHLSFFLSAPSTWNLVLWLVTDVAQVFRILYEERLLGADPEYARYLSRVHWRLVPGIV